MCAISIFTPCRCQAPSPATSNPHPVGPLKESLWGFNGFFSKKNGGGFLTDHFPLAQKSIWDIRLMFPC